MNPILAGLAIPNALPTARMAARALQAATTPFGQVLDLAIGRMQETPASDLKESTRSELQALAGSLKEGLQQKIEQAMADSGIRLNEEVRLRLNPQSGQIEVVGHHSNRATMEMALANDPEIGDDFRQLVAIRQLLEGSNSQPGLQAPMEMVIASPLDGARPLLEMG